jgi:hypothetical protein
MEPLVEEQVEFVAFIDMEPIELGACKLLAAYN